MISFQGLTVAVVYIGALFAVRSVLVRAFEKGKRLPGPKGVPILGNVFDIPENSQWTVFTKWKPLYGDVIGLSALGSNIVVINSRKALEKLLGERSTTYSDRPDLTLMKEFLGFKWSSALLPYGEELLRQRKMMAQCLGPIHHKKYYDDLHHTSIELCANIAETPRAWSDWCKLMVIKNIVRVVYGFRVNDFSDNYVAMAEALLQATRDIGSMGTHPIDVFPKLAILPEWVWGRKFAKQARIMRDYAMKGFNIPWERAKKNIALGVSHPNSMAELLKISYSDSNGLSEANEYSIKAILSMSYSAGVDTTLSTIRSFVLAMICYPEVQWKAQQVIHDVVGDDRIPDFSDRDRDRMIYLEAVLMEVIRWGVVLPLSLPHRVMEDDVYEGMDLKKGATVLPNTFGCLRDPVDYPDPDEFKPERFLEIVPGSGGKKMRIRKDVPDPRGMAFGYGRRICPGRHLAESVVWIAMVTLLSSFDFSKAPHPEREGEYLEPDLGFDNSISVSSPKPFECIIKPRAGALDLIHHTLEK